MKTIIIIFSLFFSLAVTAQEKVAYKLYNNKGKEITYSQMLKDLAKFDVVFFGEQHNDPISHWLEFEITKDLYVKHRKSLILGAEMYESDNQLIMDEYLEGVISKSKFTAEMRLWPNNTTDYQPLVDFSKEKELKFIATNIPRRYASLVFTDGFKGLEKVSVEGQKYIASLPIAYDSTMACYANMMKMEELGDHAMPTLPMAQAAKDATMAYFIYRNYKKGNLFLHFNGAYHSDNYQGILLYLKAQDSSILIRTITTIKKEKFTSLTNEEKEKADYIIVVPESMTTTY